MNRNPLDLYLSKVSAGDLTYMDKLCHRLIERLICIPVEGGVTGRPSELDISKNKFVYINSVEGQFVAAFTSEAKMNEWAEIKGKSYPFIAVLGYELCKVLSPEQGIIINSVSENKVVLTPEWCRKIVELANAEVLEEPLRSIPVTNVKSSTIPESPEFFNKIERETKSTAFSMLEVKKSPEPAENHEVSEKHESLTYESIAEELAVNDEGLEGGTMEYIPELEVDLDAAAEEEGSSTMEIDTEEIKRELRRAIHDKDLDSEERDPTYVLEKPPFEANEACEAKPAAHQSERKVITLYEVVTDEELERYREGVIAEVNRANMTIKNKKIDLLSGLPTDSLHGEQKLEDIYQQEFTPESAESRSMFSILKFWK